MVSVGHGFETKERRKGVVLKLDQKGNIVQHQELWDQHRLDQTCPKLIASLRPYQVLETNIICNTKISPDQLTRIFLVNPLSLVKATDMAGLGNACIAGVVDAGNLRPFTVYGAEALPPDYLVMTVRENARYFEGGSTFALLIRPLAAQIEDGFKELAWMRSEHKGKPSNSIEIQGLQGNHVFAMLQQYTPRGSFVADYKTNCLSMQYDSWDPLVPIMGRNASRTLIPNQAAMFEAGPPVFKWQMLPRDRVVVTLAFYKLLNAAGTAMITGNEGTSSSRREVRSILVSRQHCYFCLRRNAGESDDPRYGCVCTEQSLFETPSLPDAMEVDEDRP